MINSREIAKNYLSSELYDIKVYDVVYKVLTEYDGKILTKREHKKICAALESHGFKSVEVDSKYNSWYALEFKAPDTPESTEQGKYRAQNGFGFILNYRSEPIFTLDRFANHCNTWASRGAPQRVNQIEKFLRSKKSEKIDKAFALIHEANKLLESVEFKRLPFDSEIRQASGLEITAVKP
jgi:hypothetical protein